MATWYQYRNNNLILTLYIQPGAKHSQIVGLHGDALKIKLVSPPVDDRANEALLQFIATQLNIPLRQIKLTRGKKCRRKTVEISEYTFDPQSLLNLVQ